MATTDVIRSILWAQLDKPQIRSRFNSGQEILYGTARDLEGGL
jgi:hypothetical protein